VYALHLSAFGGKTHMPSCTAQVRFWPKADMGGPRRRPSLPDWVCGLCRSRSGNRAAAASCV